MGGDVYIPDMPRSTQDQFLVMLRRPCTARNQTQFFCMCMCIQPVELSHWPTGSIFNFSFVLGLHPSGAQFIPNLIYCLPDARQVPYPLYFQPLDI